MTTDKGDSIRAKVVICCLFLSAVPMVGWLILMHLRSKSLYGVLRCTYRIMTLVHLQKVLHDNWWGYATVCQQLLCWTQNHKCDFMYLVSLCIFSPVEQVHKGGGSLVVVIWCSCSFLQYKMHRMFSPHNFQAEENARISLLCCPFGIYNIFNEGIKMGHVYIQPSRDFIKMKCFSLTDVLHTRRRNVFCWYPVALRSRSWG